MKIDITKFQSFEEQKKKALRNDEIRREYEKLGPRFQIIRQLIEAREKTGMTQKEIAEKMGTKQSALARFESGSVNPSLDFVQRLARALSTTFRLTIT